MNFIKHIPKKFIYENFSLPEEMDYQSVIKNMTNILQKNKKLINFIGDGLLEFKVPKIIGKISQIRELLTSYTPYQPERGQGTLISLWIFQCLLSELTGFEVINCSLYDRATALFEALRCAQSVKKKNTFVIFDNIYKGDKKVIETLIKSTDIEIIWLKSKLYEKEGFFFIELFKR